MIEKSVHNYRFKWIFKCSVLYLQTPLSVFNTIPPNTFFLLFFLGLLENEWLRRLFEVVEWWWILKHSTLYLQKSVRHYTSKYS